MTKNTPDVKPGCENVQSEYDRHINNHLKLLNDANFLQNEIIQLENQTPRLPEITAKLAQLKEDRKQKTTEASNELDRALEVQNSNAGCFSSNRSGRGDLRPYNLTASEIVAKVLEQPSSDSSLKPVQQVTREELHNEMLQREKEKNQVEKDRRFKRETEWFDHFYGTEPIAYDDTGKMIEPSPIRPIPTKVTALMSADGRGLNEAISETVNRMVEQNERDQVKTLQSGLNILSSSQNPAQIPGQAKTPALKEDGVIGPKTAGALKKALVEQGTGKVSEALALGQFKDTVRKAKKEGPKNLASELSVTFKPLLGETKSPKTSFQPEGLALQDTLNDLGAHKPGFEPLKDDGIVGPKTQDAFNQIVKTTDEDELLSQFGQNLGFAL